MLLTLAARSLRTLVSAFPFVLELRAPNLPGIALASNEPIEFDRRELAATLASASVRDYLSAAGEEEPVTSLLSRFLETAEARSIHGAAREQVRRGDVNTDLFPRDEFDRFPD